jgi:hypothetical protein
LGYKQGGVMKKIIKIRLKYGVSLMLMILFSCWYFPGLTTSLKMSEISGWLSALFVSLISVIVLWLSYKNDPETRAQ